MMCLACMAAGATSIVTIQFITLPAVQATIDNINGVYVGYTGADAYQTLSQKTTTGIAPDTGDPIEVICDDFTDHTSVGGSSPILDYSESTFATPSAPSVSGMTVKYPYSGGADPYYQPTKITTASTAYEVAAILLYDYNLYGNSSNAAAYNLALWALFDPSLLTDPGTSAALLTAAGNLLNGTSPTTGAIYQQTLGASNAANLAAYAGLVVFDPTSANPSNQEFLGFVPSTTTGTPEPATLSLVGLALLGLGIALKRRAARAV